MITMNATETHPSSSTRARQWLSDHAHLLVLAAITLVAVIVRFVGLGSEPFWLDEAHTADFTKLTLGELWSFDPAYNKANPPGYIVFIKAWVQISRSDEWFRAASALAGAATIPITYLIGARVGSRRAGLVAAALLTFLGYHVRYSQEARAYAILTFLVAVIILTVVQLVTEPDSRSATSIRSRSGPEEEGGRRRPLTWTHLAWPVYGLAVGAALHMHNTSLTIPLAATVGVGVWWRKTRPRPPRFVWSWILANALGLLIWSIWIPGFLEQVGRVSSSFWAEGPTFQAVVRDLAEQVTAYAHRVASIAASWWWDAAIVAVIIVLVTMGVRRMDAKYRPIIVSFIVVHPLAELIFTLRRPVFVARTLIWVLVATVIAIGFAVSRIKGPKFTIAVAALLVLPVLTTAGYHLYFEKTAWDEAAELVGAQSGPNDLVLIMSPNNVIPFDHYFDRYELEIETLGVPWDLQGREQEGMTLLPSDFDLILDLVEPNDRVWLVLNSEDKVTNAEDLAPALAAESTISEVYEFYDLTVMSFEG